MKPYKHKKALHFAGLLFHLFSNLLHYCPIKFQNRSLKYLKFS
jgi:hypothetical protein